MRKLFISIIVSSFLFNLSAQTILSPGDLMMVTVNADGVKNFDFVPLVDLEVGTVIKFTDNAWTENSELATNEGRIIYTAPEAISAGSVVSMPHFVDLGPGFSKTGSFNPSGSGDNILVYQGDESSPSFIYGVGWAIGTPWISSGSTTNNNSYIPPDLSVDRYTILSLGSLDNYQYNIAAGAEANPVDLQALVADPSNWNSNDATEFGSLDATFTITNVNNLASNVVIAEIYAGGGNTGAPYSNDYVVLYNPTGSSVDLSTYSIQYATSSGSFSNVTNLSGTIPAGTYYGIQQASGGAVGDSLPFIPEVIGTTNLATSGGKVALASKQTAITGLADLDVIDFIGYGSANEYESAASVAMSNTSSLRRKDNSGYRTYGSNGSGYDTDNNKFDFYLETDLINNQPLPVELTSFEAEYINNSVQLNWQTATEVNNFGFDIERKYQVSSSENQDWEKIDFVLGHGTTNSPKYYSYIDEDLPNTDKLFYRLKQIDNDGTYANSKTVEIDLSDVTSVDDENMQYEFALEQNYPNPFNPVTTINFTIPNVVDANFASTTNAVLKVYNLLGQEIRTLVNEVKQAGSYQIQFDASDLPSGIYFYTLTYGNNIQTRKLALLK